MELLNLKYRSLDDLYDKMVSGRGRNRPSCRQILDDRKAWALNKKDFDYEEELRMNPIAKGSEFSVHTIIASKLMGTNGSIHEVFVKPANNPMRGSLYYAISRQERGKCIVINNETKALFKESKMFESVFSQLHFKVEMRENLKASEISSLLKSIAADKNLTKDETLAVVIITQGEDEKLFGFNACEGNDANDVISILEIVDIFSESNCKLLKQTPKLFFFNYCRGSKISFLFTNQIKIT